MNPDDQPLEAAPDRLRLLKSPLRPKKRDAGDQNHDDSALDSASLHAKDEWDQVRDQEEPILERRNDASNLEVFYDIFLTCLNLFNQNQQLASLGGLSAYVGFFSLLWTTWLLTGMYDVRFLRDSVFERCCRAVHLGVLVGFVTVSPNFDPSDQDPRVFQTFSLILMVSRLCLSLEYGSILLQLKKHKSARLPLILMVGINVAVALVYMGIAIRFSAGHDSRTFISWYPLGAVEACITLGLSIWFPILSFQGTYLMQRVSLLTLIIFGEGVTVACVGLTRIISIGGHDAWTSATIGTVVASVSTVYIVFMVYFDWLCHFQLPTWRQLIWTTLHFPLHLALTMFMEGAAQFIGFWKIAEFQVRWMGEWEQIFSNFNGTDVSKPLKEWCVDFTSQYPAPYPQYLVAMDASLNNMSQIDFDDIQPELSRISNDPDTDPDSLDPSFYDWLSSYVTLVVTIDNIVSGIYGNDFIEDEIRAQLGSDYEDKIMTPEVNAIDWDGVDFNTRINDRAYRRTRTVFQYSFVCAGGALGLMNLLYIISRRERWSLWDKIRTGVNFAVAVGLGLVASISQNFIMYVEYQWTPWILPTITFPWLLVLILHHLPLGDTKTRTGGHSFSLFGGHRGKDQRKKTRSNQRDDWGAYAPATALGQSDGDLEMTRPGPRARKFSPTSPPLPSWPRQSTASTLNNSDESLHDEQWSSTRYRDNGDQEAMLHRRSRGSDEDGNGRIHRA